MSALPMTEDTDTANVNPNEPANNQAPEKTSATVLQMPADPLKGSSDTKLNNALVSGPDSPEWQALLARPVTLLMPKSRERDAKQADWKNSDAVPLRAWLGSDPSGGLTHHVVRPAKGYFPAVFGAAAKATGYGPRKADGMKTVEFVGLDLDSGDSYLDALDEVEAAGLACIAYTSFNDGTARSQRNRDLVLKKLGIVRDPTLEEIRAYLTEEAKLRPHIIESVEITSQQDHTEDGVMIVLNHVPLEKFRLLFPLAETLTITTLAPFHRAAKEVYERKIRGFAQKLGLMVDEACFDVSRVFYMPSHRKGADFKLDVIRGRGLTVAEMPEAEKAGGVRKSISTAKIADLPAKVWAGKYASRIRIAEIINDFAADKVREQKGSILVVECPYDAEHSDAGDSTNTGCHVQDADAGADRGFVWKCKHGCASRYDRLDMVMKAVADDWFDEALLISDDYLEPLADEDLAEEQERNARPTDSDGGYVIEVEIEKAVEVRVAVLSLVESFDANTTEPEVRAVITEALKMGADAAAQDLLKEEVARRTRIKAMVFNRLWKAESRTHRKQLQKEQPDSRDIKAIDVLADFEDHIAYAQGCIRAANAANPRIYRFGDAYACPDVSQGIVNLMESQASFYTPLAKVTRWHKSTEEYARTVSPPEDVVRYMFNDPDFISELPELLSVVTTPFFAADGTLVDVPGYHAGARVYLAPGDLRVARVSADPTKEEVAAAVKMLKEEVLADFPLAGMTRPEIMAASGEAAHAIAHTLAFMLLPMAREMISGPTPGHVFTKPEAGTGATKLVDVCTSIAMGEPAAAMTLPERAEEVGKTLTSVLTEGAPVTLFDNIGDAIASPELASAMTGRNYKARILGRSALVSVSVRTVWAFTANDIKASKELLRRFVLIPMDAKDPVPEERVPDGGWRHSNLMAWVRDNRPDLVHACLTIIQAWIAAGMIKQTKVTRGSYEEWAGVMGGILEHAGIEGFLKGQKEEREKALDDNQDTLQELVDALGVYPDGTAFRPGSDAATDSKPTVNVMEIMNGAPRHDEHKLVTHEPILINGCGYDKLSGKYQTSGRIGRFLKTFARKPYKSGASIIHLEAREDRVGKLYVLTKTAA